MAPLMAMPRLPGVSGCSASTRQPTAVRSLGLGQVLGAHRLHSARVKGRGRRAG